MPLPNIYPVAGASGGAIRKPWGERHRDRNNNNNNNNSCNTVFPRDIVCLMNISINTLHKGDDGNKDDDGNTQHTSIIVRFLTQCHTVGSYTYYKHKK
jgi:hypothetical protein